MHAMAQKPPPRTAQYPLCHCHLQDKRRCAKQMQTTACPNTGAKLFMLGACSLVNFRLIRLGNSDWRKFEKILALAFGRIVSSYGY